MINKNDTKNCISYYIAIRSIIKSRKEEMAKEETKMEEMDIVKFNSSESFFRNYLFHGWTKEGYKNYRTYSREKINKRYIKLYESIVVEGCLKKMVNFSLNSAELREELAACFKEINRFIVRTRHPPECHGKTPEEVVSEIKIFLNEAKKEFHLESPKNKQVLTMKLLEELFRKDVSGIVVKYTFS